MGAATQMSPEELRRLRLQRLRLDKPLSAAPEALVQSLAAVQAQDYAGAKWALGQRLARATDAALEACFERGAIVRTHVMRPTWHFVAPQELRWLQALTRARVLLASASYFRKHGLDEKLLGKCRKIVEKALSGKQLTRDELALALVDGGVSTNNDSIALVMLRLELDCVVASGARRGKQFTYALFDERIPSSKQLEPEHALSELALRYFTTRGPAQANDFAWWSGLSVKTAQHAIQLVGKRLLAAECDGKQYYFSEPAKPAKRGATVDVRLLSNYDEYLVAYKDRALLLPSAPSRGAFARDLLLANHVVVRNGVVVGGFRRTLHKADVQIEVTLLESLDEAELSALEAEAARYANFLGLSVDFERETAPLTQAIGEKLAGARLSFFAKSAASASFCASVFERPRT
ncbi:MAG: winged helix DNA-binding domain-containing protein [Polyangiaceae bacterium]